MKPQAIVCWSGGKDCMLALWQAREQYAITGLLTTVTHPYRRISMHGVRVELLEAQAMSLGVPLTMVEISSPCSNAEYEQAMRDALEQAYDGGVDAVICGDLFLEDVRRYREERLLRPGTGVFPLWGITSRALAERFIDLGFRAVVCCVDTQQLDASFAGRAFDAAFLAELPPTADPCGENGEFHTFVYDGPPFAQPIDVQRGKHELRDARFMYCDLCASEAAA